MAWELLPVDYTDAVWSGLKKYSQIDNDDGTISLQDVTVYTNKEKSFFGAMQANRMNEALNTIMSMVENGTDLYEAFQNYFALQKQLFEDKETSEFNSFVDYTDNLKLQGDEIIDTIQTDYRAEMDSYESVQEQSFDAWFATLTEELTVATSVVKYESQYTTLVDGETTIPINIASFNEDKDVLLVRINRLFAVLGVDYTITNNTEIELTKDLTAGQSVDFIVLQSVVVGDTTAAMTSITAINERVTEINDRLSSDTDWIDVTLEAGTSFDNTTTPACRKFGNTVHLRGAIKGVTAVDTTICTLPSSMKPAMNFQFTSAAISSGTATICVFEVSASTGTIKLIAKNGTIASGAMLPFATNFIIG